MTHNGIRKLLVFFSAVYGTNNAQIAMKSNYIRLVFPTTSILNRTKHIYEHQRQDFQKSFQTCLILHSQKTML